MHVLVSRRQKRQITDPFLEGVRTERTTRTGDHTTIGQPQ